MMACGYSFETNETLDAYLDVVANIERSNSIVQHATTSKIHHMDELFRRKTDLQPLSEAVREVSKTAEEFNNYIDKTIDRFYEFTKNKTDKSEGYFQHLNKNTLRNQQPVNDFFITGYNDINGNFIEPEGAKIREKLVATRSKFLGIINNLSEERMFGIRNDEIKELTSKWTIPNLEIYPYQNDWVENTFGDKSVAATYANLIMLKNDVLSSSDMAVSFLAYRMSGPSVMFDKYVVVSSPRKIYIKSGETFKADIFLSAASSQSEFSAKINGKTYPVEDGVILYEAKLGKSGTHSYEAEISLKHPNTGRIKTYKQTFQYEVGECYY